MNLDSEHFYIFTGIMAAVVIIALWLAKTVGFTANKSSVSLFTSKKDSVNVEGVEKSKVDIKNRDGQDVTVKKVTGDSNVKIR